MTALSCAQLRSERVRRSDRVAMFVRADGAGQGAAAALACAARARRGAPPCRHSGGALSARAPLDSDG
jgi:hypothetical protein